MRIYECNSYAFQRLLLLVNVYTRKRIYFYARKALLRHRSLILVNNYAIKITKEGHVREKDIF